jgi:pyruvate dehydrogenase E2 component (dihydrolipoamide acetyltransferase)
MPVVITMPKLTDSMEEGRIVEWQVRVGDRVSEGDVLAEIETDKAVMELESFWAGVVAEILRPDGDVVPVGEAIARIAQTGESLAAPPEREARLDQRAEPAGIVAEPAVPEKTPLDEQEPPTAHSREPEPVSISATARVSASPRARKLAKDKGLDIGRLQGTGSRGRITVQDVEAAASPAPGKVSRQRPLEPPQTPAEKRPPTEKAPASAEPAARVLAEKRGIELGAVAGTGLGGRITVRDVLSAVRVAAAEPPVPSTSPERADEELPPVTFSPRSRPTKR